MEEMEIVVAGLQTVCYCSELMNKIYSNINQQEAEEDFGTGKFAKHQKMLWDFIEHSESSKAAEVGV